MDADISDAPCRGTWGVVLQGRGADQEAPSPSSAPLRGPAPHKGDQQVIRCACCEICARKDWPLSCERVRAGYHHSTGASPRAGGFGIATLIWKLSDRGTTARLPKNGTLRQGEALSQVRTSKEKGLQPSSSTFATGVRASTNQKQKRVPPVYSSVAWDHWSGRDCAAGRPSRSLCF